MPCSFWMHGAHQMVTCALMDVRACSECLLVQSWCDSLQGQEHGLLLTGAMVAFCQSYASLAGPE
jgi:hypothetical protein